MCGGNIQGKGIVEITANRLRKTSVAIAALIMPPSLKSIRISAQPIHGLGFCFDPRADFCSCETDARFARKEWTKANPPRVVLLRF
jgi:hypothetical protein